MRNEFARAYNRKYLSDPEKRDRVNARQREGYNPERQRERRRGQFLDPEWRERRKKQQQKQRCSPAYRARKNERQRERRRLDPEFRARKNASTARRDLLLRTAGKIALEMFPELETILKKELHDDEPAA